MGRPLGAQNKDKPFRDALRMEQAALATGEVVDHPKGSLRWNAQRLLMLGEVPSIKEVADRLDGKVPQALTGEDGGPIQHQHDLSGLSDSELAQLAGLVEKAADAGGDQGGGAAPRA